MTQNEKLLLRRVSLLEVQVGDKDHEVSELQEEFQERINALEVEVEDLEAELEEEKA